jgi:hypothetical protein
VDDDEVDSLVEFFPSLEAASLDPPLEDSPSLFFEESVFLA